MATNTAPAAILRDAVLRTAPQDEVLCIAADQGDRARLPKIPETPMPHIEVRDVSLTYDTPSGQVAGVAAATTDGTGTAAALVVAA